MKYVHIFLLFIFILSTFSPGVSTIQNEIEKKGDWSKTALISTESTGNAYRAIIAVDQNGTIHIAWKDTSNYKNIGTNWHIFYKNKPKGGNWTKTEIVTTETTGDCSCLSMVVDQQRTVHIAWTEQSNSSNNTYNWNIFYKQKPWNKSWTSPENVTMESTKEPTCPCIAADSRNTIHIVWGDNTNITGSGDDLDVFYKQRVNNQSWTSAELVSTESSSDSFSPWVAVSKNGIVHVVWEEKPSGSNFYNIFYKRREQNGSWTSTELVSTNSSGNAVEPMLAVDEYGTIHLIYVDNSNVVDNQQTGADYDVFYRKKPYNGTWTHPELVSIESTADSEFPCIAVDKNNTIHVVWCDRIKDISTTTWYNIFYKYKPQNGSWTKAELVSNESNGNAYFPRMVVDNNRIIHVSWWEETAKGWRVYYRYRYPDQYQPNQGNTTNGTTSTTDHIPGFTFVLTLGSLLIFFFFLKRKKFIKF